MHILGFEVTIKKIKRNSWRFIGTYDELKYKKSIHRDILKAIKSKAYDVEYYDHDFYVTGKKYKYRAVVRQVLDEDQFHLVDVINIYRKLK